MRMKRTLRLILKVRMKRRLRLISKMRMKRRLKLILKKEDEKETQTHVDELPTCSTAQTWTYVKPEQNEDESTSKQKRFRKF